jgi:hypothetical protein
MNVRPRGDRLRPERFLPVDDDKKILRHSLGTGATPLTTTGRPEVAKRQNKVQDRLRKRLLSNLVDRSPLIQKFAEQNFLSRFERRLDRNRASYDTRLVRDIPVEIRDIHDRVLVGDGSPKDALVVMSTLGMRSIELSRLTHPNIDMEGNLQLDGMNQEVFDAVIELGGELHDDTVPTYELSNIDTIVPPENVSGNKRPVEHAAVREGMMATVKHHIATLQDGTRVVRRTSYIMDLNELPEEISQAIRSVNTLQAMEPLQAVAEAAQLNDLLPFLIELGSDEKSLVPISTTIYAYNETIAALIASPVSIERDDTPSEHMQRFYDALEHDEALVEKQRKRDRERERLKRLSRGIGRGSLQVYELPGNDGYEDVRD